MASALALAGAARADVTERVGLDPAGHELPAGVASFLLSRDGGVAIFTSGPSDDECSTFFIRDLPAARTECARFAAGVVAESVLLPSGVSFSGRFVAFRAVDDATGDSKLLLWDRESGEVERIDVSSAGDPSAGYPAYEAAISRDGRFVAFVSAAGDLVAGESPCGGDFRGCSSVYLRDRGRSTTERVSVAWDGSVPDWGSRRPSLSDDGRFIAFQSSAGNLVRGGHQECFVFGMRYCTDDIYLFDRRTRRTVKVVRPPGFSDRPTGAFGVVDDRGRYVDYALARPNGIVPYAADPPRVFRYDIRSGTTRLLFVAPKDAFVSLPLSADARFVTYLGRYLGPPYLLWGVEVRDSLQGAFVHDRLRRTSRQIDVALDGGTPTTGRRTQLGTPIPPDVRIAGVSASGESVGFVSDAVNLVAGDDNATHDAFVRRLD